jgi:hypothetical protein
MRAFLLFAAFTLMRPSELFALEWADIDFDAMRISKTRRLYRGKLAEPKTGPKTIALTPPARDAMLGQPRDSALVFTSKTGKRLSSTNMFGYWNLVTARAGLDFDLYHATKHYGVWFMWTKLGMSNRAIAAQAGWSSDGGQDAAVYGHGDVGALDEVDAAFARPRSRRGQHGPRTGAASDELVLGCPPVRHASPLRRRPEPGQADVGPMRATADDELGWTCAEDGDWGPAEIRLAAPVTRTLFAVTFLCAGLSVLRTTVCRISVHRRRRPR